MPNWAEGTFKVRGKKEDIIKFLKNELLGTTFPVFGEDKEGKPTIEYQSKVVEIKEEDYDYTVSCEGGFYINGSRRAFIEESEICFYFYDEEVEMLEICGFKQAWAVIPDNYIAASKKYNLDFKIFAFEMGMEFTQEIEIIKGKITKDIAKEKYEDYFWDVPFSGMGG